MSESISRRKFLEKSSIGATGIVIGGLGMSAKSYGNIIGANDRINIAMLGCYRRGNALTDTLANLKGKVNYLYACDVIKDRREELGKSIKEKFGVAPKLENDFRVILDDAKVDAVFHATPDHWHAPGAILTLQAGKHAYVEKPLSHNPGESELLVMAQKKYNKVVQMGAQQRSALESIEIIKEIHNGIIGDAYMATAFYSNARDSIGKGKVVPVPAGFDWDLFQGPAPRTEFKDILADYNWHWFWLWGTGETGNNATHELDVSRWALQLDYPEEVRTNGGKFHYKDDDWTMYDTLDATFKFANGKIIKWDGKSRNSMQTYGSGRGTIIYGTEGSVYVDRGGYKLFDRGGKMLREKKSQGEEGTVGLGGGGDMTTLHVDNFLEAIKGNVDLNCPVDEGAKSTHLCHLANISYRLDQRPLKCDTATGKFIDADAMKLWGRVYEEGWEPKV